MTDRYKSRASTHADDCWSWGHGHYEDKRRTQSLDTRRARIYQRISEVWDQLGDEFTAGAEGL